MIGNILLTTVLTYCSVYTLYFLVVALAGKRKRSPSPVSHCPPGRFAVIVAAYAEDAVLPFTLSDTLQHNYPPEAFRIFVAAEAHRPQTLALLRSLPVTVIETKGKKGQAIAQVLEEIDDSFDYVLVLDADNTLQRDCLARLNAALSGTARVVQAHRKAKNHQTSVAVLDGVSEEVNNHLFRRGQQALGFSASLIGSGMAFRLEDLRRWIRSADDIWEDRELELRILSEGVRIHYLCDAVIRDEKVSSSRVFFHQRIKWVGGQVAYLRKTLRSVCKGPLTLDLTNKLVLAAALPRSVFLVGLLLATGLSALNPSAPAFPVSLLNLTGFLLVLLLAIPPSLFNRRFLKAIMKLPLLLGLMMLVVVLSLFRGKTHYHTPHVVR